MNEDGITLNFIAYSGLLLAMGVACGWFLREVVYNAVKNASPKKKVRIKKAKMPYTYNPPPEGLEPPDEPTPAPPVAKQYQDFQGGV